MLPAVLADLILLHLPLDTGLSDTSGLLRLLNLLLEAFLACGVLPVRNVYSGPSAWQAMMVGCDLHFALTSINFILGSLGPPSCTPSPRSLEGAESVSPRLVQKAT